MSDRLAAAAVRPALVPVLVALVVGIAGLPASATTVVPDPTRPAVMPVAPAGPGDAPAAALVLQSTLVSPRQRSVIINGQRYRLGERVGDARIEAIGAGWVRLRGPTGATELRLSYPTSTRPVNR